MPTEDIRGLPASFASLRMWDELAFAYVDMLLCHRDADVRPEMLGMHAPPLTIVRNVRFGSSPPQVPVG